MLLMNEDCYTIVFSLFTIICCNRSNNVGFQSGVNNACHLFVCCENIFTNVVGLCVYFLSLCWLGYYLFLRGRVVC
jgi:hypothetical protein